MVYFSKHFSIHTAGAMKVKKTHIETEDLIFNYLPANYIDSFKCEFTTEKQVSADDIMIAFWTSSPKWVGKLFTLRDWIVKPFGIQSGNNRNNRLFEEAIRNSGCYRFISVVEKSDNETVISANDKHLKMYFSVKMNDKKATFSTVVHFHNFLGRVYFYMIYPFHKLIVKAMIKSAFQSI